MRLVGKLRLSDFAKCASPGVRGAAAAFLAEIEAADWSGPDEAFAAYPNAECSGCRLSISLDEDHCVTIAINYEAGIILIEFVGRREDRACIQPTRHRTIS